MSSSNRHDDSVEYNDFFDSGEVGLTATAGLEDGIIRYNRVFRADYTGIQVGNPSPGYTPVKNVSVYGNIVEDAGEDAKKRTGTKNGTQPHSEYALPGIAMLNVDNVCVVNNVVRAKTDSGIWIHDAMTATGVPFAGRFQPQSGPVYISHNDVSNSEIAKAGVDEGKPLDYTQSGSPSHNNSV